MNTSSDALLLSTKLKMPAPRRNYVVRKALFDGKSWRSALVDEDGETAISVKL